MTPRPGPAPATCTQPAGVPAGVLGALVPVLTPCNGNIAISQYQYIQNTKVSILTKPTSSRSLAMLAATWPGSSWCPGEGE